MFPHLLPFETDNGETYSETILIILRRPKHPKHCSLS